VPRTCLACNSPQREEIDNALAAGHSFRDIAGRFSLSRSALHRHKNHVAQAIVEASEKREEKLGDNLVGEMRRLQQKAWDLLARTEAEGDSRGAIVALREVRECLRSLGEMLSLAPNGIDLTTIPDDLLREEAERRNLKLELVIHVVTDPPLGAPKP